MPKAMQPPKRKRAANAADGPEAGDGSTPVRTKSAKAAVVPADGVGGAAERASSSGGAQAGALASAGGAGGVSDPSLPAAAAEAPARGSCAVENLDHVLLPPTRPTKHGDHVGPTFMEINWINQCNVVQYFEVEFEDDSKKHRGTVRTKGTETRLLVTGLAPCSTFPAGSTLPKYKFRVRGHCRGITNSVKETPWSYWTRALTLKEPRGQISQQVRRLAWSRFYHSPVDKEAGLLVKMPCLCCVVRKPWGDEPEMLSPLLDNVEAGHVLPFSPYGIVGSEADEAWNFVPMCKPCNLKMSNTHLIDFFTDATKTPTNMPDLHRAAITANLIEILLRLRSGIRRDPADELRLSNDFRLVLWTFAKTFYNDGVLGLGGVMEVTKSGTSKVTHEPWHKLAPGQGKTKRCYDQATCAGHDLCRWAIGQTGKLDGQAAYLEKRIAAHEEMVENLVRAAERSHRRLWSMADEAINAEKNTMLMSTLAELGG
jgi:hypothetical protein